MYCAVLLGAGKLYLIAFLIARMSRSFFLFFFLFFWFRLVDIVLLSIDRSLVVTLFEGSSTAAVAVGIGSSYPDSNCIGSLLAEVWPDERLGLAVKKILSEDMDAADWLIETEAE